MIFFSEAWCMLLPLLLLLLPGPVLCQHGIVEDASSRSESFVLPSETPLPGQPESENVPPHDEFYMRTGSSVAVLGDFIYLEGGIVQQYGNYSPHFVNATLAIDLTKSWNTSNVEIIETFYNDSSKPTVHRPLLLIDDSSDTFYAWGSHETWETLEATPQLWEFTPTGGGRGDWEDESPGGDSIFVSLRWTIGSAAVSTNTGAYIFGGLIHHDLQSREVPAPLPGFLALDYETKRWSQEGTAPYAPNNTMYGGGAVFAPEFGPNGLVFVFGGLWKPYVPPDGPVWASFETLHFMDPVTREWYSQNVTGDVPPQLDQFCTVGVDAGNGTFDIFVFGGAPDIDSDGLPGYESIGSDVRVLSLPAFHWRIVPLPEEFDDLALVNSGRIRWYHDCAVVGNRHLLSWGGFYEGLQFYDRFHGGLGIFDMSELSWTHRYDAEAGAYRQHAMIREFYDQGRQDDVQWSSTEVRELFLGGESPTPRGEGASGDGSSTPVGAIAGGVVGGVVVIAAIAGLVWCLRKKRRTREAPVSTEADSTEKYEAAAPGVGNAHEAPDSTIVEMNGDYLPPEMHAGDVSKQPRPRYEVDGTGVGEVPWYEQQTTGR